METYRIVIDGKLNEYIRGRISGMIHALTGEPEKAYAWYKEPGDIHWATCFDATIDQYKSVIDCIEKAYPDALLRVEAVIR